MTPHRLSALACVLLMLSGCVNSTSVPWQTEDQLYAVDGTIWVVGNHLVTVPADAAQPPLGSRVHISGARTSRGELVVDTVEVLNPPAVQQAPAPRPTPRVQPTPPRAPTPAPVKKPHRNSDNNGRDD